MGERDESDEADDERDASGETAGDRDASGETAGDRDASGNRIAPDDLASAHDDEGPAIDPGDLAEEIADIRDDLDDFEAEIEERTVHREEVEADLKRYVRRRLRRGHARGWGPYLVLLYGTAMTLGAFVHLEGGWAILAMVVIWLSTLGLYVLMVLIGLALSVAGVPGRAAEWLRDLRS